MKKFLMGTAVAAISLSVFLGGCFVTSGVDGTNGKDGQNASVNDWYELAKKENPDLTIDQFLKEYLNYSSDEVEQSLSLQANMNRSLLAGVTVASKFTYTVSSGFWGSTTTETGWGFGSGVIIKDEEAAAKDIAYVVTNCHVVYDDSSKEIYSDLIYCYLYGQDSDYDNPDSRVTAEIVAASITYDIALLKVSYGEISKNSTLLPAEFSESEDVYVGSDVYVIGNSEGSGMSATRGVITKEREDILLNLSTEHENNQNYARTYSVIRTDAAVNEGNSGGAMFGRDGKIAGIINSKAASYMSGDSLDMVEAMGYALPAGNVKRLIPLMKHYSSMYGFSKTRKTLKRATLSCDLEIKSVTTHLVNDRAVIEENVCVTADSGELKGGDSIRHIKITNMAGKVIEDMDVTRLYHVKDTLLSAREGYIVTLTVSRAGKEEKVTAPIEFSFFD